LIRLMGPAGVSQVYGKSGRAYMVAGDGTVTVSRDDADALKRSGVFGTWSEVEMAEGL
jgi:hypothetical protein